MEEKHALKEKKQGQRQKLKKTIDPSKKQQPKKNNTQKIRGVVEQLLFLFFILLCLFFIFRVKAHYVDGQSMAPTFSTGDRLLIHKGQAIERNDIVTFEPLDTPGGSYVKRVIGLPGDRLFATKTQLYLFQNLKKNADVEKLIETNKLPDSTLILDFTEAQAERIFAGVSEIPVDQYLVLGDNRQNSKDSRAFGLINTSQIEGVVNFRFYPLNKWGFVH